MTRLRSHSLALAAFAAAFLAWPASSQPAYELRPLAAGLVWPVAVTHAQDSRLFITLQRGQVVIYDGTRVLPAPFLDIRSIVNCPATGDCGEQGLLSIAFHPNYRDNGFFYVYHTDLGGDLSIARYSRSASDADRADPSSRLQILRIAHPVNANHNGGQLQFGPDGYLYIGTGDGGGGGDQPNNAQNLTSLLGKMLRIDVNSGSPYAIPPSNPFASAGNARGEVWAYGLRNPWRFSFDRQNGDLWIADVGQNQWEEIDLQPASSIGGENYGWRRMEGTHCYNPQTGCQTGQLVLPVIEYDRSGGCSVTGGYRYRGSRSNRLRGAYIYADYCTGDIWAATLRSDGSWTSQRIITTDFLISAFGEDVNGEIYVARHSASSGALYQIVDPAGGPGPRRRAVRR